MNDGSRRSRGTRSWFSKRRSRGQHAAGECGARQPVACQPDRAGKCRQSRRSIAFGSDAAGTPDRRYAGAHLPADEAPLQTGKIATALIRLNEAQNNLRAVKGSVDDASIAAAEAGVRVEMYNVVGAIKQEAERLSRPSSFGPPAHHAGDLRKVEARIRAAFPSDAWEQTSLLWPTPPAILTEGGFHFSFSG